MNLIRLGLCIVLPMVVLAADGSDIVINEIMYHPASGLASEEYVELYNRGATAVDLGGWYFTDGIRFTFPPNTFCRRIRTWSSGTRPASKRNTHHQRCGQLFGRTER